MFVPIKVNLQLSLFNYAIDTYVYIKSDILILQYRLLIAFESSQPDKIMKCVSALSHFRTTHAITREQSYESNIITALYVEKSTWPCQS